MQVIFKQVIFMEKTSSPGSYFKVPPQGPTLGSHLRAPPQGLPLGSHLRVLGPTFPVCQVAALRTATLLKKRLWRRCFPVNFAKILRTTFLQNTSGQPLLRIESTKCTEELKNLKKRRAVLKPLNRKYLQSVTKHYENFKNYVQKSSFLPIQCCEPIT